MTDASSLKRPDKATLGVALFLAVIAAVIWFDMQRVGSSTGYSQVGPASVPTWIAAVLMLLAICTAFNAFRGKQPARVPAHLSPVLWMTGGLILQMLLLMPLGFTLATGVMFACVARAFGERRWHVSLPAGLLLSFVVFVFFTQVLNLSLPGGPLENLFF